MLERLLKLYVMAMANDVRSPMPHLVGPPGCGKSTYVEQLAELTGVELHIINVSRLSPLDVEGVQMPHGTGDDMHLRMLPATFWTSLKEGDILLMDEFLRGFPEVYNALLDIFTSRRVGALRLPKVFIIGASNSVTAYDAALEDRLMHLTVPDLRSNKTVQRQVAELFVEHTGMHPNVVDSIEMRYLLENEVMPTYNLLDAFKKKGSKVTSGTTFEGRSIRNLIGQIHLRNPQGSWLKELVDFNNRNALQDKKPQFVLVMKGDETWIPDYIKHIPLLEKSRAKLTPRQLTNFDLNQQLIDMAAARKDS